MKSKIFRITALTALTASLLWNIPSATALQSSMTYYVSPTGNDANAGTIKAPFKTLAKALSVLKAGNTLYIRAGTYTAPVSGWNFSKTGSARRPITITNYPGERVVLKANNRKSGNYIIKCLQTAPAVNHIRIVGTNINPRNFGGVISSKGIIMTGARLGIAPAIVAYNCDNWEVAGVDFIKVAYGIFQRKVDNGNTSADNWYVHDNRVYEYYRESGMQFNGNSNRIENNEIIKVTNDYNSPYGCQLLNLLGNNNTVRGNKLTRLSTIRCIGIFFEWDLADANLVENNIITGVANGITFYGGDNNVIRNNQITGEGTAFVVRSWANGATDYPCNFTDFMPLRSDVANPDWNYMYPHDCYSKGNRFEGNTVSGFIQFSSVSLPEPSNVFINSLTINSGILELPVTISTSGTLESAEINTVAPTEKISGNTVVEEVRTPEAIAVNSTLPTGISIYTDIDSDALFVGEPGMVTISLNGVPAEGIAGVEFACTYAADQISIRNIQIGQIFGVDSTIIYDSPQSGSFIFSATANNGIVINADGIAFTFTVSIVQPGSSSIDCKVDILNNAGLLESIPSVPDSMSIIIFSIPAVPSIFVPALTGQVIASKPITITLINPDGTLAVTATTNPDGSFSINVPAGTYTVIASAEGHLTVQGSIMMVEGATTTLGAITLPVDNMDTSDQ